METVGVHLGRFAPYHKGHQMVSEAVIEGHGADKSLIMVGSATSLNERTPFTFEQRRAMIQKVLGTEVEIFPLPDFNPAASTPAEGTFQAWRDRLKEIAQERDVKFKFYGGSQEDIDIFAEDFESEVIVDRETAGQGISATEIRTLLHDRALEALADHMDSRIIEDAIDFYHTNIQELSLTS